MIYLMCSEYRENFGVSFALPDDVIYLDSATIGRLPISSIDIISEYYKKCGGVKNRGTHEYSICANVKLEKARKELSSLLNLSTDNISFSSDMEVMLTNILFSHEMNENNHILTSMMEDHSLLGPVYRGKKLFNYSIDFLHEEDESDIVERIKENVNDKTSFVVLSSQTVGIGIKRDWKRITKLLDDLNIPLILDVSRTMGLEPLVFNEVQPDYVLCNGPLGILGPIGSAFMAFKENHVEPLIVGTNSINYIDEKTYSLSNTFNSFETGFINTPAIVSMVNSFKVLNEIGLEKIHAHQRKLRELLVKGISDIVPFKLIEIEGCSYGPIMALEVEIIDTHDLAIILEDLKKIIVRSGGLCAQTQLNELNKESLVQLSTHVYNIQEDIKITIEQMQELSKNL